MLRSMAAVVLLCLLAAPCPAEKRIKRRDILAPTPLPERSVLVIGFLGAWENWDNSKRSVRKVALRLRENPGPNVFVETAGNHSRSVMRKYILDALDRNRDKKVDEAEAKSVGIILYGQSFGGAAAVYLARDLQKRKIPVLLTVQVDSVGKNDGVIPSNVKRAVNLYQRDPGSIWGQSSIRPEDASNTQVLLNMRHYYILREIDMSDYPKVTRGIMSPSHWKMDNDPLVWAQVEGFIRAEIIRWQAERILNIK